MMTQNWWPSKKNSTNKVSNLITNCPEHKSVFEDTSQDLLNELEGYGEEDPHQHVRDLKDRIQSE